VTSATQLREHRPHQPWARPPGGPGRTLWAQPTAAPGEARHPGWARRDPRPRWMRSLPRTHYLVAGTVLVAAVAVLIVAMIAAGGPTYPATITNLEPVGQNQVVVTLEVRNTADAAATPTCQVQVYSPAYGAGDTGASGMATFVLSAPVPADGTGAYAHVVDVTAGRADTVTVGESSVSCR